MKGGMTFLKIAMIAVGIFLIFLVIAMIRVATKTVAEKKSRPPVVQQQQPQPSDTGRRGYGR